MKKILLIDIDSKIPNLAMMKLSSYHKSKGNRIHLLEMTNQHILDFSFFSSDFTDPNHTYISCVFSKNKYFALAVKKRFTPSTIGGYGISNVFLPNKIEHTMPDYDLYGIDYSLGFSTRGCPRKCPWCIVPKMEGKFRFHKHISTFHHPDHKKVVLLDNNILASPTFKDTISYITSNNLKVSFNQGLDIRLITDKIASLLSNTKYYDLRFRERRLYLAWDTMGVEHNVMKAIRTLTNAGIRPDHLMFYVLCGFNTTHAQDKYRIDTLISHGVKPYVMKYNGIKTDKWLNKLAKWINRRYYRVVPFADFDVSTHKYRTKPSNT